MAERDDLSDLEAFFTESTEPSRPDVPRITVTRPGLPPMDDGMLSGTPGQPPQPLQQAGSVQPAQGSDDLSDLEQFFSTPSAGSAAMPQQGATPEDTVIDPRTAWDTEGGRRVIGDVHNMVAAMNDRLVRDLALPSETVNALLTAAGLGIVNPGDSARVTREAFENFGVRTRPFQGLSAQMGDAAYTGFLQASALIAAAPGMAAKMVRGASVGGGMIEQARIAKDLVIKGLGEIIQRNPALATFASTMGGEMGARYAEQKTQGLSEKGTAGAITEGLASLAGALSGGAVGQIAATGTAAVARGATAVAKGAARKLHLMSPENVAQDKRMAALEARITSGTATQADIQEARTLASTIASRKPLLEPDFKLGETTIAQVAEHQLDNSMNTLYTAVANAIERVPQRGTAAQLERAVAQGLEKAYQAGLRIQGEYWERAGAALNLRVPMNDVMRNARALARELAETPSVAPMQQIREVIALSSPVRGADGRMVRSLPTIRRVRDQIKALDHQRRTLLKEGPGLVAQPELARNIARLERILDDAIDTAHPNNVPLQQARAYSKKFHDLFDEEGISAVMRQTVRGNEAVPGEKIVETLMAKHQGLMELFQIRDKLAYVRQPGANRFAITKQERADLQQLTKDTEDSLRAMYREEAASAARKYELDPNVSQKQAQAAKNWYDRNAKNIVPLARVSAELESSAKDAVEYSKKLAALGKSDLARLFAVDDPQKVISMIWGRSDHLRASSTLLKELGNNPDARKAYSQGMLAEFWKRTKNDPMRMAEELGTPSKKRMLFEALGPDTFNRLKRNVDAAVRIASGDLSRGAKLRKGTYTTATAAGAAGAAFSTGADLLLPGTTLIAGIAGAAAGRALSTGTIQGPGLTSAAFRRTADAIFKTMPAEELFALAMTDPKMERALLSRLPRNNDEFRKAAFRFRAALAGMIASKNAAMDAILGEDAP